MDNMFDLPAYTGTRFNCLDSVVQQKRKIKEIATPLSRLAMTSMWERCGSRSISSGLKTSRDHD